MTGNLGLVVAQSSVVAGMNAPAILSVDQVTAASVPPGYAAVWSYTPEESGTFSVFYLPTDADVTVSMFGVSGTKDLGTYSLSVTAGQTYLLQAINGGSANVDVTLNSNVSWFDTTPVEPGGGEPDPDDGSQIYAGIGVLRWRFRDLANTDTITVPINPNKMSGLSIGRNMNWSWGTKAGQNRMRGISLPQDQPMELTFEGVIHAKAHYDLLLNWTKRQSTIRIHDHLGRVFDVVLQKFDPVERRASSSSWKADYTMTCLLLKVWTGD